MSQVPPLQPPPRIDPTRRVGSDSPAHRRPRIWVVGLMALLVVSLVLVVVVLPRLVDDPTAAVATSATATPVASEPTPAKSATPNPSADEGLLRTVNAALDEGLAALAVRDPEKASTAFGRAVILDPGNQAAEDGLRRAQRLTEVQVFETAAVAYERRGDLGAAAAAARSALELDPSSEIARGVDQRLARQASEDRYEARVTRGLESLELGQYQAALDAFTAAAGLRPGTPEVADGIARAQAGIKRQEVEAQLARGAEAEQREDWATAVAAYRAALELEPVLAVARDGAARSEQRLELVSRMVFHLENPTRLATPKVLGEAADLVVEARAVTPRGPRFDELVARLDDAVERASTPVRVTLESDGLTSVMLYRVGQLGTFEHHTVDLRPGTYTAVGRRPGFRDVRLTIEITAGGQPTNVVIRCTDRI